MLSQPHRHFAQSRIARCMAVIIIEWLEAVHINHQHAASGAGTQ